MATAVQAVWVAGARVEVPVTAADQVMVAPAATATSLQMAGEARWALLWGPAAAVVGADRPAQALLDLALTEGSTAAAAGAP